MSRNFRGSLIHKHDKTVRDCVIRNEYVNNKSKIHETKNLFQEILNVQNGKLIRREIMFEIKTFLPFKHFLSHGGLV